MYNEIVDAVMSIHSCVLREEPGGSGSPELQTKSRRGCWFDRVSPVGCQVPVRKEASGELSIANLLGAASKSAIGNCLAVQVPSSFSSRVRDLLWVEIQFPSMLDGATVALDVSGTRLTCISHPVTIDAKRTESAVSPIVIRIWRCATN